MWNNVHGWGWMVRLEKKSQKTYIHGPNGAEDIVQCTNTQNFLSATPSWDLLRWCCATCPTTTPATCSCPCWTKRASVSSMISCIFPWTSAVMPTWATHLWTWWSLVQRWRVGSWLRAPYGNTMKYDLKTGRTSWTWRSIINHESDMVAVHLLVRSFLQFERSFPEARPCKTHVHSSYTVTSGVSNGYGFHSFGFHIPSLATISCLIFCILWRQHEGWCGRGQSMEEVWWLRPMGFAYCKGWAKVRKIFDDREMEPQMTMF